jgi:hypothetical protein
MAMSLPSLVFPDKLTGSNYKARMKDISTLIKVSNAVEIRPTNVTLQTYFDEKNQEALLLIRMSVSDSVLPHVREAKTCISL